MSDQSPSKHACDSELQKALTNLRSPLVSPKIVKLQEQSPEQKSPEELQVEGTEDDDKMLRSSNSSLLSPNQPVSHRSSCGSNFANRIYKNSLLQSSEKQSKRSVERVPRKSILSHGSSFKSQDRHDINNRSRDPTGPTTVTPQQVSSFGIESSNRMTVGQSVQRTSDAARLSMPAIKEVEMNECEISGFASQFYSKDQKDQRVEQLTDLIEDDDLVSLQLMNLTLEEIRKLRFEFQMNFLQLVCHEESITILKWLTHTVLKGVDDIKDELVQYRDAFLGSQAIHLAATTGNHAVIKCLIEDYGANIEEKTTSEQTVQHCASQGYNGIVSIFLFSRTYNLPEMLRAKDSKQATPLHFAVISLHFKNVQALIKLGADPNAQDIEGNTPLHLCVQCLESNPRHFDKLKNIGKELLFSGASRLLQNSEGFTPGELLESCEDLMEIDDYRKMRYVLTQPTGIRFLRMTRPIEKVERKSNIARTVLVFDLLNIAFFIASGFHSSTRFLGYQEYSMFSAVGFILTNLFFLATVVFYLLTIFADPGYVPNQNDFQQLLQKLVSENFHLDYVCVYCENLRPENADHCNFCNRCVQKFDHHCVFINNCIGYKNHKWFILLIISFTFYMLALLGHSIFAIIALSQSIHEEEAAGNDLTISVLRVTLAVYLILVVFLHSPVVGLQVQSQYWKLIKTEVLGQADETQRNDGETGTHYDQGTNYDQQSHANKSHAADSTVNDVDQQQPTKCTAFWRNFKILFTFKPQSQEYLYKQLFGADQDTQSRRSGKSNASNKSRKLSSTEIEQCYLVKSDDQVIRNNAKQRSLSKSSGYDELSPQAQQLTRSTTDNIEILLQGDETVEQQQHQSTDCISQLQINSTKRKLMQSGSIDETALLKRSELL